MENENIMKQHDGESENLITQPEFTYLKLTTETPGNCAKSVSVTKKDTRTMSITSSWCMLLTSTRFHILLWYFDC